MKKTLIATLLLAFFCMMGLEASDVRTITKNLPVSGGRFIALDDLSYWVIYPVAKKQRSFFQWLRGKQIPQPEENFLFDQATWKEGTKIALEEQFWTKENQQEMEKYHQAKISTCSFIFKNVQNTQMAFAREYTLEEVFDLFMEFAEDRYELGKKRGFDAGWDSGWDSGYRSGY